MQLSLSGATQLQMFEVTVHVPANIIQIITGNTFWAVTTKIQTEFDPGDPLCDVMKLLPLALGSVVCAVGTNNLLG